MADWLELRNWLEREVRPLPSYAAIPHPLAQRILNALASNEIDSLEQLRNASRRDLRRMKNLGDKSINFIMQLLQDYQGIAKNAAVPLFPIFF